MTVSSFQFTATGVSSSIRSAAGAGAGADATSGNDSRLVLLRNLSDTRTSSYTGAAPTIIHATATTAAAVRRTNIFPALFASPPPLDGFDTMNMYHLDSTGSTQDEARNILKDPSRHEANAYLVVTTASQTHGRGTQNRTWFGQRGNTFLTVAVPSDDIRIPLSLLPLQIGVLLAENISHIISSSSSSSSSSLPPTHLTRVTVKWPNDVLVNEKKIAGVLIESEKDHAGNYYFLIGIGINYKYAPKIEATGPDRGRLATCIHDYLTVVHNEDVDHDDGVEEAKELGIKVARDIKEWVDLQKIWEGAAEDVVTQWEKWAIFGQRVVLRDTTGNEMVIPLRVEKDGRLRVKGQDGRERLLCFDYLL